MKRRRMYKVEPNTSSFTFHIEEVFINNRAERPRVDVKREKKTVSRSSERNKCIIGKYWIFKSAALKRNKKKEQAKLSSSYMLYTWHVTRKPFPRRWIEQVSTVAGRNWKERVSERVITIFHSTDALGNLRFTLSQIYAWLYAYVCACARYAGLLSLWTRRKSWKFLNETVSSFHLHLYSVQVSKSMHRSLHFNSEICNLITWFEWQLCFSSNKTTFFEK